jgi:hypothetical protein
MQTLSCTVSPRGDTIRCFESDTSSAKDGDRGDFGVELADIVNLRAGSFHPEFSSTSKTLGFT